MGIQPLQTYSDVLIQAFAKLWTGVFGVIPNIIGALIIFLIGWIIALAVEQVITQALRALKANKLFDRLGWSEVFERAGVRLDISKFIGGIVRWFFVLAFLLAAADLLALTAFTNFLRDILAYIPNIFAAALILLAAALLGDFSDRVLVASVKAAGFGYGKLVGGVARWSIFIFALLAALVQLQVAPQLIQTFFTGFVAMVAIAGGIAFGMGGREVAADVLARLRDRLSERS